MSLYYSSLLDALIDWTDEEILLGKKFLDWQEVSLKWNNVDLHWEDIFILFEVKKKRGGGSGYPYKEDLEKLYKENNPWRQLRNEVGDEKSEKIIKVLCKINNIEYSSILENKIAALEAKFKTLTEGKK